MSTPPGFGPGPSAPHGPQGQPPPFGTGSMAGPPPFAAQGPPPQGPLPQGTGAPPPGWPGAAPGWQGPPPGGGAVPPTGWSASQGWTAPPPPAQTSPDALRRIAQILCPILVLAGLSIPQSGSVGWADYTLWALFAAVMSLVQGITLVSTRSPGQSATIALIATGALVAYWVVIVLPGISSNGGFLQTLGVGCAAVAAWLGNGRR